MFEITDGLAVAIWKAQERGAQQVSLDDLAEGCLRVLSRMGVLVAGPLLIDLEELEIDWLRVPERTGSKVSYSDDLVRILDRAAAVAKADGQKNVGLDHALAAFAGEDSGLIADWRRKHRVSSAQWRSAVAGLRTDSPATKAEPGSYLTPEDAASELGIHVQTVRAYVRSGKLPASRIAGERAIRIRREDLPKLMEQT